jgi:thimet oligopeptidase
MYKKQNNNLSDILNCIPKNLEEIKNISNQCIIDAENDIAELTSNLEKENPSFEESFQYFDQTRLKLVNSMHILMAIELLHGDKEMRDLARDKILSVREYILKNVDGNIIIYSGLKKLINLQLNGTQEYYRDQLFLSFNKNGMDLTAEDRQKFQEMQLEINAIAAEFDLNISAFNSKIAVTKQDLEGLPETFIENLEKDHESNYLLGDNPTYFRVMAYAKLENTRKIVKDVATNKAYPQNYLILEKLVNKRDELSKLLGYKNYAEYDIMGEMALNPENTSAFIRDLEQNLQILAEKDYLGLITNLPESVKLTPSGKLYTYDLLYITNEFKKTNFTIDELEISSYFPMEKTMNGLLNIYSQIFSVNFEEISNPGELWDKSVKAISVKKDNNILGYIFLDLFPRDGKYSHARVLSLQPSTGEIGSGSYVPGAIIVICNFQKPAKDTPALFTRSELNNFFHEFGHALHGIFINTPQSFLFNSEMAMTYGLPVKTDFVEVPSELFEKWLSNKDILKNLSSHYETNQQLSDELLDKIVQYEKFNNGIYYAQQLILVSLSLELYSIGKIVADDVHRLYQKYSLKYRPFLEYNSNDHYPASLTHLNSYGAKYYSYI